MEIEVELDPRYRLMFEDVNLEPIDDYDVFDSESTALNTFDDAAAHPTPGLGAVYLVERRDDGDVVIAGHYFIDPSDQRPGRLYVNRWS
jgi:hypothetical protein